MSLNLRRSLIALGALVPSLIGLLAALFGLATIKGIAAGVVLLVWLSAIAALARMVIAWIQDKKLGPGYSKRAFLFGVASMLAIPLLVVIEAVASTSALTALMQGTSILLFEIVISATAIGLAWHLNRFHSSSQETGLD